MWLLSGGGATSFDAADSGDLSREGMGGDSDRCCPLPCLATRLLNRREVSRSTDCWILIGRLCWFCDVDEANAFSFTWLSVSMDTEDSHTTPESWPTDFAKFSAALVSSTEFPRVVSSLILDVLEYKEPGDGCLSSHLMVRVKEELGRGDLVPWPLLLRSSDDKVVDSWSRDEVSLVLDSFRLLARLCEKPSPGRRK